MSRVQLWGLVFCLLLGVALCIPPILRAQECLDNPSCNAIVGSLAIPASSTDAANRVLHAEEASPDGLFTDEIIGLTYNRSWNTATTFNRDDITQPMTWL